MIRGFAYFALVLAAGFVLGLVRVSWLVPQVGERVAELMEAPIMLCAIFASTRRVLRRFPAAKRFSYLGSGVLALLLLLATEFSLVLGLRDLTLTEYFASRDPVAGAVYVAMLLVFASMPWLLGRDAAGEQADEAD